MGRTFVICEAGISHCGDLRTALDCIDIAKNAGGDAVKFQTFQADKLAIARGKPELATTLKPYEMPYAWLPILKDHCDKVGIEFMTTCYYEEAIKEVAPFVRRFKVGHAESTNYTFLSAHDPYLIGSPPSHSIIISRTLEDGPESRYPTLYVVPEYPTPLEDLRLSEVTFDDCGEFWGISDHSKNVYTGMMAVAAGAKIVEVHFESTSNHQDNCVSLSPWQLKSYVDLIRLAETAVYGSGATKGSPELPAPQPSHQQG